MNENATAEGWSQDIRQAFAYSFDYNTYISTVFSGLATQPATAIIQGLTYYNASITGYSYNLAKATALLNSVPGLNTTGFTLDLYYNTGNTARMEACQLLASAIGSINSKYVIKVAGLPWDTYLGDMEESEVPMFSIGWLVDFPDPHDFAFPFYDSAGAYGAWQALPSNWPMDSTVLLGIATPDGPARQAIYNTLQQEAVTYCPDFPTDQPLGSHFQQDWVQGWYYNAVYPGIEFYNEWKWYYSPQAQLSSTPTGPLSEDNTADLNYDGKVDMKDIAVAAASFGSSYGPPVPNNWVYRADVNNDRKVDMKDIAYIASYFGDTSLKWSTSLGISLSPGTAGLANATGQSQVLTATTSFASGTLQYNWTENGVTLVRTFSTSSAIDSYTFTPLSLGTYSFVVTVQNSTGYVATSNTAFVYVGPQVTIDPLTAKASLADMIANGTTLSFDSVINGGTAPYATQWYITGTGITNSTLTADDGGNTGACSFGNDILTAPGTYHLYLNVIDNAGLSINSTQAVITVTS